MSAMGKVDVATELKEMNKWRVVTYVAIPVCIIKAAYDLSQAHGHHEQPDYPYLRIRSKEFPWGNGKCDLFDSHCKEGGEH